LDSLKIGHTVLHSPQFTQLSARAEARCAEGAGFAATPSSGATWNVAPIAAGSPRPRAGPANAPSGPRNARATSDSGLA
jgi:hypothetical protein